MQPGPAEKTIIAARARRLGLELRQLASGSCAGDWQLVVVGGTHVAFGSDRCRTWSEVCAWLDEHDSL